MQLLLLSLLWATYLSVSSDGGSNQILFYLSKSADTKCRNTLLQVVVTNRSLSITKMKLYCQKYLLGRQYSCIHNYKLMR